jgi:anaerobic selenocysteine-containing dehydrogenase
VGGTQARVLDTLLFEGMLATFVGKPDTPCADTEIDRAREELGSEAGTNRLLDLMLRSGPYGDAFGAREAGLTLEKLKALPHALDLGPLAPRLPELIRNADRRLHLVHEVFERDIPRLIAALEAPIDEESLRLIGRRGLRGMNSWLHNLPNLAKGPPRCSLLISPQDAERIGLTADAAAKVQARTGSVVVPIEISDEMMPGVVSLPHGYGHLDPGTRLSVASRLQPGANSNQLCDDRAIDVPSSTSIANGIPVRVTAA